MNNLRHQNLTKRKLKQYTGKQSSKGKKAL